MHWPNAVARDSARTGSPSEEFPWWKRKGLRNSNSLCSHGSFSGRQANKKVRIPTAFARSLLELYLPVPFGTAEPEAVLTQDVSPHTPEPIQERVAATSLELPAKIPKPLATDSTQFMVIASASQRYTQTSRKPSCYHC